jgi:predicted ATP-binding protein involved in virulence
MSTAPKGYYRQLLESTFPMVRIAFTHTPMYNVTVVDSTNVLRVLDTSDDEYAKYYADGIRSGTMVTIVENAHVDRYFEGHWSRNISDLYFKS